MAQRVSAYLIILGFLLGNIIRIPVLRADILVSPLDIAVIVTYLLSLTKYTIFKSYFHPSVSLIVYALWLFLSLLINADTHNFLPGLAYLLRYLLYLFSFFPLKVLFTPKYNKSLITAIAIMFPVIGVVQYFWFPDLRPFTIYGWDMHYFRVFGTYLDPGFYGLILFWSLLNLSRFPVYWAFSYLIFAFTYSRSSFVAMLIGSRNVLTALLIILTLFLLPRDIKSEGVRLERTASVSARTDNWQDSLKLFKSNPFTGVGFNILRYKYQDRPGWEFSHAISGSDSSLIFILTTSGLIGLGLYLNLLRQIWIFIRNSHIVSTFFIGLFIHSFFLNSQFFPPIMLLFSLSLVLTVDKSL